MMSIASRHTKLIIVAVYTITLVCSNTGAFTSPVSLPRSWGGASSFASRPVVVLRETSNDDDKSDSSAASTIMDESSSSSRLDEAREEANDALASVGWSRPMTDEEMTSDDPFVRSINEGIRRDVGVELDELLNPSKVVNLERDLFNLRLELAEATGVADPGKTTAECDGGGGGEDADKLRKKISKKESDLSIERRSVFRGWLKNIFLGQAVLSLGLSWVMVTDPTVIVGSFENYERLQLDTSVKVLGFWWWWLFIVPSLRSRRPKGAEKKALDIAFLGTPLVSILAPVLTKDTPSIWIANLAVVLGSYGYAYFLDNGDDDAGGKDKKNDPEWLKFVYKSLDFGSGRERGLRN